MLRQIKNYYHLIIAFLAAAFYSFPSKEIKVIGVTGTDGKTTTVHMIYEVLIKAGYKASYISSLHGAIGSKIYKTGFHVTTPSAWQIQRLLRQAVSANHDFFVVEATSHGLDQNRLSFIDFAVGVLTNITHEHLDYHKTWENYALAKLKLLKMARVAIVNLEDQSYKFITANLGKKPVTFGHGAEADVNLKNYPLSLSISGRYNLSNALAACAASKALGINSTKTIRALNKFQSVEGRMQKVSSGQKFAVYIDFAHTPNALKEALITLKAEAKGKRGEVIAVFGAAGQRDKTKRPQMGKTADNLADVIILTSEDPRTEPVEQIMADIQKGIKSKKLNRNLFVIKNRQEAIDFAINLAKDNSVIGLFGKGHERSMCFGKVETPWNEFETARLAIKRRLNAGK